MLYLYLTLSLLMSTATVLQGASSSSDDADSTMLARMTAKASQSLYKVTSADDEVQQLMAQNSQRHYEQFSPQRAVAAQKKFNEELSDTVLPMGIYVPIATTASELQQCFKQSYMSVPMSTKLSFKTIMMLTPDAKGNKLEAIMLASPNKAFLELAVLKTAVTALSMLGGGYERWPLLDTLFDGAFDVCSETPSYAKSNIQEILGSSFKFTRDKAPAEPVMAAHALLPRYFEFDHQGDIALYVGALDEFAAHFDEAIPNEATPILIPDVQRLQAYLAQKDVPATVIVDNKELTNPEEVMAAIKPEYISELCLPKSLQIDVKVHNGRARISQEIKLRNLLARLPDVHYSSH